MQKKLCLGFLLLIANTCFAYPEDPMYSYDPMTPMLMYGMFNKKNTTKDMSFWELLAYSCQIGFVRAISGLTGRALETAFSGSVKQIGAATKAAKKALVRSIYGNNKGFEVREILCWRAVLESDSATHISTKAKGARVVRAHTLETQTNGTVTMTEQSALKGIQILKSDLEYMCEKLNEYEPFYSIQAKGTRSTTQKILDLIAFGGLAYTIGDCFVKKTTITQALATTQYWQKLLFDQQAEFLKLTSLSQGENSDHAHALAQEIAKQPGTQELNAFLNTNMRNSIKQLNAIAKQPNDYTSLAIKSSCIVYAIVRFAQWLRSEEPIKAANALSTIQRDLVTHIIGTLRSNFTNLITLCDSVKNENDLVGVKDDFENIVKNCIDILQQLAYLIDQEETIALQRLGKPGQQAGMFNQGLGGFGAGIPKL